MAANSQRKSLNLSLSRRLKGGCEEGVRGDAPETSTGPPVLYLPEKCPVCLKDLVDPEDENQHVNQCLESQQASKQGLYDHLTVDDFCFFCGKLVAKFSLEQRMRHLNRCMDTVAISDTSANTDIRVNAKQKDFASAQLLQIRSLPKCPCCSSPWADLNGLHTPKQQLAHVKVCAKEQAIRPHVVIERIRHAVASSRQNEQPSEAFESTTELNQTHGVKKKARKPRAPKEPSGQKWVELTANVALLNHDPDFDGDVARFYTLNRDLSKKKVAELESTDESLMLAKAMSASLHPMLAEETPTNKKSSAKGLRRRSASSLLPVEEALQRRQEALANIIAPEEQQYRSPPKTPSFQSKSLLRVKDGAAGTACQSLWALSSSGDEVPTASVAFVSQAFLNVQNRAKVSAVSFPGS
jgi:hypothetical protein